jgi:nitroreductase
MVQSPEIKTRLSKECMLGIGNQYRTKDASVLAVFLSDLELGPRIDRIEKLERDADSRDPNYLNVLPIAASFLTGQGHAATLIKQVATDVLSRTVQPMPTIEPVQAWSYKNTSLAAQTYVLAATSHGLATCIMEGLDTRRAKDILRIPDRYDIPLMVATGYDYDDASAAIPTPRLDLDEVVFGDTFGEPFDLTDDVDDEEEVGSAF